MNGNGRRWECKEATARPVDALRMRILAPVVFPDQPSSFQPTTLNTTRTGSFSLSVPPRATTGRIR